MLGQVVDAPAAIPAARLRGVFRLRSDSSGRNASTGCSTERRGLACGCGLLSLWPWKKSQNDAIEWRGRRWECESHRTRVRTKDRNCSRSLAAFGGKSGPRSIKYLVYVFANRVWNYGIMFALLFGFALNFAIAEYVTESNGGLDAQAILVPPTLPSTATGSTTRRP